MSKIVRTIELRRYRAASDRRSRHALVGRSLPGAMLTPTGFLGVWGCCIIKRYRTPPHDVAPVRRSALGNKKRIPGFFIISRSLLQLLLQRAGTYVRLGRKAYLVGLYSRQRGDNEQCQYRQYHVPLTSHSPNRRVGSFRTCESFHCPPD